MNIIELLTKFRNYDQPIDNCRWKLLYLLPFTKYRIIKWFDWKLQHLFQCTTTMRSLDRYWRWRNNGHIASSSKPRQETETEQSLECTSTLNDIVFPFSHNEFAIFAVPRHLQSETIINEGQSGIIRMSKTRKREIERHRERKRKRDRGQDESVMVRQGTPRLP